MDDEDEPTLRLLSWRVQQLEHIEAALRLEVHELRATRAPLEQVYTRDQSRNVFVTREEAQRQATVRREWPLILASLVMAAGQVATLIAVLSGGH